MTEYQLVPATEEHAHEMALVMREADREEVWASGHFTPLEALLVSLEASPEPKAGLADGKVFCMYVIGQQTLVSNWGCPWLLTAEDLPNHAREFLRRNKEYMVEVRSKYRLLLNYVDARNTMSVRWLIWLGFLVGEPQPFGVENRLFRPFRMETK